MFRGRRTNSHLSRDTRNRNMHSAVNQLMHTVSMILEERQPIRESPDTSLRNLLHMLSHQPYLCWSSVSAVFQSGKVLAQSITMEMTTNTTDTEARICAASDEVGSSMVSLTLSIQRLLGCSGPRSSSSGKKWTKQSDRRSSRRRWQHGWRSALSKPQ